MPQLILGLIVCFVSFGLYMMFAPFTKTKHDYVSQVCQIQIFLALLSGVIFNTESSPAEKEAMSYILMALQALPPGIAAFLSSPASKYMLDPAKRKKASKMFSKLQDRLSVKFQIGWAKLFRRGKFAKPGAQSKESRLEFQRKRRFMFAAKEDASQRASQSMSQPHASQFDDQVISTGAGIVAYRFGKRLRNRHLQKLTSLRYVQDRSSRVTPGQACLEANSPSLTSSIRQAPNAQTDVLTISKTHTCANPARVVVAPPHDTSLSEDDTPIETVNA